MSEHRKPVDFSPVDFDTFAQFITLSDEELELATADARARRAQQEASDETHR